MTSVEYISAYSPSHEGRVGPLDNKKLVVHKLVVFGEPRDSQAMTLIITNMPIQRQFRRHCVTLEAAVIRDALGVETAV